MGSRSFDELRVNRLAEQLAEAIWQTVRTWDRLASDTIGKQLIRAADSIGANIAEGFGRGTFQDNRRFIRIARGSLYETRHWLRRAFQRNLLSQPQIERIKPIIDSLGPQLNAYLKSIGTTSPASKQPMTND